MKKMIFLLLALHLVACNKSETAADNSQPNPAPVEGEQSDLEKSMIDFGFKSFLEINSTTEAGDNILISPLSIETALYMSLNAANDETLQEMLSTLECGTLTTDDVNQHYSTFLSDIARDATEETYMKSAQAALWSKERILVHDPFKQKIQSFYGVELHELEEVDFVAATINAWANDKTEGRIPEVIQEIEDDEILFLMNALYFLGDWAEPFLPEATRKEDFHLITGQTTEVDMMGHDKTFRHYRDDDLEAVDLMFADEKYAMTLIQTEQDLDQFLLDNTVSQLSNFYIELVNKQFREGRIVLNLPKFELSYKRNISDDLKALGMPRAFIESEAQFYDLGTAGGHIYMSRVLHDTYLKIDEKGAEGAAVTTVVFAAESLPPTFTFDKPFLIVLRHVETGVPVFIGKMMDPSA